MVLEISLASFYCDPGLSSNISELEHRLGGLRFVATVVVPSEIRRYCISEHWSFLVHYLKPLVLERKYQRAAELSVVRLNCNLYDWRYFSMAFD